MTNLRWANENEATPALLPVNTLLNLLASSKSKWNRQPTDSEDYKEFHYSHMDATFFHRSQHGMGQKIP